MVAFAGVFGVQIRGKCYFREVYVYRSPSLLSTGPRAAGRTEHDFSLAQVLLQLFVLGIFNS